MLKIISFITAVAVYAVLVSQFPISTLAASVILLALVGYTINFALYNVLENTYKEFEALKRTNQHQIIDLKSELVGLRERLNAVEESNEVNQGDILPFGRNFKISRN